MTLKCGCPDNILGHCHDPKCPHPAHALELGKVCSHGSLQRQCRSCELEAENKRLTEALKKIANDDDPSDCSYKFSELAREALKASE